MASAYLMVLFDTSVVPPLVRNIRIMSDNHPSTSYAGCVWATVHEASGKTYQDAHDSLMETVRRFFPWALYHLDDDRLSHMRRGRWNEAYAQAKQALTALNAEPDFQVKLKGYVLFSLDEALAATRHLGRIFGAASVSGKYPDGWTKEWLEVQRDEVGLRIVESGLAHQEHELNDAWAEGVVLGEADARNASRLPSTAVT